MTDNLALLLDLMGRVEEAEPLHRRALDVRTELLGADHPMIAVSYANLATNLIMRERYAEAETAARRSVAICLGAHGDLHPRTSTAMRCLGSVLFEQDKYDSAGAWLKRSIGIQEQIFEPGHPGLNHTRELLATLMIDTGREDEAEPMLIAAADAIAGSLPEEHWRHAGVKCRLAWCYAAQGKDKEAGDLLSKTRAAIIALPNAASRIHFCERNARLYESWGMPEEAAVYREALE
jgi:tetratricopeptide (TPR) repeat protein